MKVAHYQLECHPGEYEANFQKVLLGIREADAEGVDIVSFPESFLTGYFSSGEKAQEHSFTIDGPQINEFLEQTAACAPTFMVGFNETRGDKLFNTVLVAEKGKCLGTYSKAFPCFDHFTPGREFPVFRRGNVTFGVIICADGGFIEPTRILALKGAQIVFAPHYNYLPKESLINHFQSVRADHTARARENGVWFLRGNQVGCGFDEGMAHDGVGYGDSYLIDPMGEVVVRSQRHVECAISAKIDVEGDTLGATPFFYDTRRRSVKSGKALGPMVTAALDDIE